MQPAGGFKLTLQAAGHDDRRVRFAAVVVAAADSEDETSLVTDSRGRLRYHLTEGEYRLRLDQGVAARFVVSDHGWTTLRIRLP